MRIGTPWNENRDTLKWESDIIRRILNENRLERIDLLELSYPILLDLRWDQSMSQFAHIVCWRLVGINVCLWHSHSTFREVQRHFWEGRSMHSVRNWYINSSQHWYMITPPPPKFNSKRPWKVTLRAPKGSRLVFQLPTSIFQGRAETNFGGVWYMYRVPGTLKPTALHLKIPSNILPAPRNDSVSLGISLRTLALHIDLQRLAGNIYLVLLLGMKKKLKLTFSPLKMMVSNRNFLFQGSIFRGCVSFREGRPWKNTLPKFNSSPPEKLPKPNMRVVFQPLFFRGELLNFGGVAFWT